MTDNLQTEALLSFIAMWTLQWLKGQSWFPFVSAEEKNWNKLAAGFFAFLGSAGIIFSAQHLGAGDWTIHITGLTWQNVAHVLGHAVRLYGEQKFWFKTVVSTPSSAIVSTLVKEAVTPPTVKP